MEPARKAGPVDLGMSKREVQGALDVRGRRGASPRGVELRVYRISRSEGVQVAFRRDKATIIVTTVRDWSFRGISPGDSARRADAELRRARFRRYRCEGREESRGWYRRGIAFELDEDRRRIKTAVIWRESGPAC
jgi:hypothetical protein